MALAAGLPLWWFLGLGELIFFVLALPMAARLLVSWPIRVPSWFGLWLAFLAVVLFSGPLMSAHAPGTIDASLGTGSLTFLFRFATYVLATVFMLYVVNVTERELPTRVVSEVLAAIFVVGVIGGVAGILAPGFEFTSLMERLLPTSLAKVDFVQVLIHPALSDVEEVLGYPEARPKAPYAYANSWGANFTVTLPFFIWCYWGTSARWWRRVLSIPILVAAAVTVTYSLNRGLWIGIGLAALVLAVHQVRKRGTRVLPVLGVAALVLTVGFLVSPLADVVAQRLHSPHSNARRSGMVELTVSSVTHGSPILGFGNTRKLQGSFYSIAGDATPACPFCAVPPLGTQGHAWLVFFAQGFLGTALFFGFLLVGVAVNLRRRDPFSVACTAALVPLIFETLIYDTLGSAFVLALLVYGLMARTSPVPRVVPLERLALALRVGWRRVVAGGLVGLGIGLAILATQRQEYQATTDVLFPQNPVYLDTTSTRTPKVVTIDTESRIALAKPLTDQVRRTARAEDARFSVTAVPGSRVLRLTATGPEPSAVERASEVLAASVIKAQQERLRTLRSTLVRGTEARIRALARAEKRASPGARGVYSALLAARRDDRDRVARTLLLDARLVRSAQVSEVGKDNRVVPPVSGLALGVVLGGLAAVLRPRTLERGSLHRLAPDVLVLGPGDRHMGTVVRTLIEDRHGVGASVCVVTVAATRKDVRWLRRTLEDGGITGEFRRSTRLNAAAQSARALTHDAVILVVGRRPEEFQVRQTLDLLASVGRFPDVIMVGATRLIAGPRAHWTTA